MFNEIYNISAVLLSHGFASNSGFRVMVLEGTYRLAPKKKMLALTLVRIDGTSIAIEKSDVWPKKEFLASEKHAMHVSYDGYDASLQVANGLLTLRLTEDGDATGISMSFTLPA